MARTDNLTNFLDDVAVAIKSKKGYESTQKIPAGNFDTEISSITTVNNQNKTITPTTSQQIITADQGYTGIGTATVQPVTSSIDQNIVAGNIKKNVTILGVTGTFEGGAEDLTNVLNAQDEIIENLKSALDEKAGKGGAKLNVFTQLTEPTTKKGIWLQINKVIEHLVSDDNVFIGGTYEKNSITPVIPYKFYCGSAVSIGNTIYIFGGNYIKTNVYKYDTSTNTWSELTIIPYDFDKGSAVSIGNSIYLFGGEGGKTTAYKYDTLTDTYTQIANIPYSFYSGSAVSIGTDIYLLGGYENGSGCSKVYKYDTLTDIYTQLSNLPYIFVNGSAVSIGTDIYLFGSSINNSNYKKCYKYNTLTNSYTSLEAIPYDFYSGGAAAIGTNIYLFGGDGSSARKTAYKYNTLTNVWTQLTNIPYDFYRGSSCKVGKKIYLFGGSGYPTKTQIYNAESKEYENNTLVIAQGKTYNVGYNVELITVDNFEQQPLYGFADAWFYTTQDGLDGTMPVYYGDGTQWINIKNPPSNETNDEGDIKG